MRSSHAFALCQPGAERWLKQEVARLRPDLHAGFQRPGLVTFRAKGLPFGPEEAPPSVFARVWACSSGAAADADTIRAVADRVGARRLFVGERDQGVLEEVPPARLEAARSEADALRAQLSPHFLAGPPAVGDCVLDVVTSPGEQTLVGWHDHSPARHTGPCGRYDYPNPVGLPARAWRRVHEGLLWSGAPLVAGQLVLEIGAAPGGCTRAFVERGARVYAVDPQPMNPGVLALPGVTHIPRAIGDVRLEELPNDVAWIACDANIAPIHVVGALRRIVPTVRRSLRGMLLTLKLNDDATVAALPDLLERIRALGCRSVVARQLPSNRHDLFEYGAVR